MPSMIDVTCATCGAHRQWEGSPPETYWCGRCRAAHGGQHTIGTPRSLQPKRTRRGKRKSTAHKGETRIVRPCERCHAPLAPNWQGVIPRKQRFCNACSGQRMAASVRGNIEARKKGREAKVYSRRAEWSDRSKKKKKK